MPLSLFAALGPKFNKNILKISIFLSKHYLSNACDTKSGTFSAPNK